MLIFAGDDAQLRFVRGRRVQYKLRAEHGGGAAGSFLLFAAPVLVTVTAAANSHRRFDGRSGPAAAAMVTHTFNGHKDGDETEQGDDYDERYKPGLRSAPLIHRRRRVVLIYIHDVGDDIRSAGVIRRRRTTIGIRRFVLLKTETAS